MSSSSDKEPIHDGQCIVCLKAVRQGDELCNMKFGDHIVSVCCPLCFAALQADPPAYLGRKLPPWKDNPSMF